MQQRCRVGAGRVIGEIIIDAEPASQVTEAFDDCADTSTDLPGRAGGEIISALRMFKSVTVDDKAHVRGIEERRLKSPLVIQCRHILRGRGTRRLARQHLFIVAVQR